MRINTNILGGVGLIPDKMAWIPSASSTAILQLFNPEYKLTDDIRLSLFFWRKTKTLGTGVLGLPICPEDPCKHPFGQPSPNP